MASPLSEQLTGVQPSACKPSLLSIYLVWSGPRDPRHEASGRVRRSIVHKLAPGNLTRRRPWGALVELLWDLSNEHPFGAHSLELELEGGLGQDLSYRIDIAWWMRWAASEL